MPVFHTSPLLLLLLLLLLRIYYYCYQNSSSKSTFTCLPFNFSAWMWSSFPDNGRFFVPTDVRATMGVSNRVVWTSDDTVPHTVTSDDDYQDPYSGLFDSRERPEEEGGPFVMPGEKYEFLFTQLGEYSYDCEPHPWMTGIVRVVESFA